MLAATVDVGRILRWKNKYESPSQYGYALIFLFLEMGKERERKTGFLRPLIRSLSALINRGGSVKIGKKFAMGQEMRENKGDYMGGNESMEDIYHG
jgi:hypothetical protein